MESNWRPRTATDIALSDDQLMMLGFIASAEAQAKSNLTAALKALEGLSKIDWMAIEQRPIDQILNRLVAASGGDAVMLATARRAQAEAGVLILRHQTVHGVWGINEELGLIRTWDTKRNAIVEVGALREIADKVAAYTFVTKACMIRAAELIRDGVMTAHPSDGGPYFNLGGIWVKL